MARPIKEGLSYFPLDVDIFDDPKILFVADRFDSKGEIITIKLLCWIYRNGYYCQWDDEHALIFAKKNFASIKAGLCQDVVSELLKRGFFNEDIFESFGVLTSRAIQERWQNVIDKAKRKAKIIPELNLLDQEETITEPEETTAEQEGSTQSKGKESKLNKTKGKESTTPASFSTFWNSYGKQVKKDRTEELFEGLSPNEQILAIDFISTYKKYEPNPKFRKNPDNYITEREWEKDHIRESLQKNGTGPPDGVYTQTEAFTWLEKHRLQPRDMDNYFTLTDKKKGELALWEPK